MKARPPITLWLGIALILACEALLFVDVRGRGVAILPASAHEIVLAPQGVVGHVARWVAINMTPLCWVGFLLVFDGLLGWLVAAAARDRRSGRGRGGSRSAS